MSFNKILFKLPQYNSVIHKLRQSFQQSMKKLQMVKSRNQNMQKHPLPLPNPPSLTTQRRGMSYQAMTKRFFMIPCFTENELWIVFR